jgi:N6-L-threonylcarbamoyladenine synthase
MLTSPDFDFSFSGLKTAVRYAIAGRTLTDDEIRALARDFEEAAVEVLVAKLAKAAQTYGAPSVIIGGGVAANQWLRQKVAVLGSQPNFSDLTVYLPDNSLSTDNSVMIALAGHAHLGEQMSATTARNLRAYGNKSAYDKLPE